MKLESNGGSHSTMKNQEDKRRKRQLLASASEILAAAKIQTECPWLQPAKSWPQPTTINEAARSHDSTKIRALSSTAFDSSRHSATPEVFSELSSARAWDFEEFGAWAWSFEEI